MKQQVTKGIILQRTNFDEANRIITVLTPDKGKLRLMARGVRKIKSKLAGGIELFSVSSISFIKGKGEVGTLTSSRLIRHFGHIVESVDRTMLGYDLIKIINKATEDEPESSWFHLLEDVFAGLDDYTINLELLQLWFYFQLLKLSGNSPNLLKDVSGEELKEDQAYNFDSSKMAFISTENGIFQTKHIKCLRLLGNSSLKSLNRIKDIESLSKDCLPLAKTMTQSHVRL